MATSKDKVRCNGCGYEGPDWLDSGSAHSWGRCPNCGTTNLEIEIYCEKCGTRETPTYGSMVRCLNCFPEPSPSNILSELEKETSDPAQLQKEIARLKSELGNCIERLGAMTEAKDAYKAERDRLMEALRLEHNNHCGVPYDVEHYCRALHARAALEEKKT